jgi:hypothetical protein
MPEPLLRPVLLLAAAALLPSCGSAAGEEKPEARLFEGKGGPQLRRFSSEAAFGRYVDEALKGMQARQGTVMYDMAPSSVEHAPAPPGIEAAAQQQTANPEITNNQTVGVDEGGIVKQIGRFLVVLQDGRLFTIDTGRSAGAPLRLAGRIDVYRSPQTAADWYDEILVLGDRILVTAYNYKESASEITVIRMAPDGQMRREGRFLLNSNDYYSTDNYATRLVGDQLVFYAPVEIASLAAGTDGAAAFNLPRLRRADGDGEAGKGEALVQATDIYTPAGKIEYPVLHTLAVCPLKQGLDCKTTAFVGPSMRELYVSPEAAFLWIGAADGHPWSIDYGNRRRKGCAAGQEWVDPVEEAAMLYRLPLDGGKVGAVAVDGVPANQFAFNSRDGRFRALLSRGGAGCRPSGEASRLVLLDMPVSGFGTRMRHVAAGAYRPLPRADGEQIENRFIGDWLVYGARAAWGSDGPEAGLAPRRSNVFAVPLNAPGEASRLQIPHDTLRLERAGNDAVATGYRGQEGLSVSYLSLAGGTPRVTSTVVLAGRFESEGRSHAFGAWTGADGSGAIGLPTAGPRRSERGWSDSESSDLSFIAIGPDKSLSKAGELRMKKANAHSGYSCVASCVDWYGNSRAIFTGGRIFALMGTELVEGRLSAGRIGELGRLDLTAPGAGRGAREL